MTYSGQKWQIHTNRLGASSSFHWIVWIEIKVLGVPSVNWFRAWWTNRWKVPSDIFSDSFWPEVRTNFRMRPKLSFLIFIYNLSNFITCLFVLKFTRKIYTVNFDEIFWVWNFPSRDVPEHYQLKNRPIFVPIRPDRAAKLVAGDGEVIERNYENRDSFVGSNSK